MDFVLVDTTERRGVSWLGSLDTMGTNAEFRPTFKMTENEMYVHSSSNFRCVSKSFQLKCFFETIQLLIGI